MSRGIHGPPRVIQKTSIREEEEQHYLKNFVLFAFGSLEDSLGLKRRNPKGLLLEGMPTQPQNRNLTEFSRGRFVCN